MWCDNCDDFSYSEKTVIRITKDGREMLIKRCAHCGARVESEIVRPNTVRIDNDPIKLANSTNELKRGEDTK